MKPIFHFLIAAILAFHACADPLADHLFPPELLARAKEEVPLTDEQRQQLQKETDKVESRFREIQECMQKEADTLVELLKPGHVDEAAALAQLDKVIDAEREIKRVQIGFMIAIKNQLTPEQQAKLTAFRKAQDAERARAEELQKRIVAKAERVRAGVEKLVANGGDTTRVAAIMDEARKLMDQRKPKDAEAAIDRALKELGEEK